MSVRGRRDKGRGRGGSWIALGVEWVKGRRGGEVIGFGRNGGLVSFVEPGGGMSDPHKRGEAVTGGEEKELAGKDYNIWNYDT
jgi:hypothetical protein